MPPDAAVWSNTDAGWRVWTRRDEIAAATAELIHQVFISVVASVDPDTAGRIEPLHIQRPVEPAPRRMSSTSELFSFFQRKVGAK